MGKGTDVAREAASIVMMDDNFSMIPYSLAEGRRLLENLRRALAFYLGAKLGFILLFIMGTLWDRSVTSPLSYLSMPLASAYEFLRIFSGGKKCVLLKCTLSMYGSLLDGFFELLQLL